HRRTQLLRRPRPVCRARDSPMSEAAADADGRFTPDLGYGVTWPSLDTFTELARTRRVIPVVRRLLADAETPVGVYRKLAKDAPGTFLLESAEHGGVWSRYSIVRVACSGVPTEKDGLTHWIGDPPVGVPVGGNPLEALRDTGASPGDTPH